MFDAAMPRRLAGVFTAAATGAARRCLIICGAGQALATGAPLFARWHRQWLARLQEGEPLSKNERRDSCAFLTRADDAEGKATFRAKQPLRFTGS